MSVQILSSINTVEGATEVLAQIALAGRAKRAAAKIQTAYEKRAFDPVAMFNEHVAKPFTDNIAKPLGARIGADNAKHLGWGLAGAGLGAGAGLLSEGLSTGRRKRPLSAMLTGGLLGGTAGGAASLAHTNIPALRDLFKPSDTERRLNENDPQIPAPDAATGTTRPRDGLDRINETSIARGASPIPSQTGLIGSSNRNNFIGGMQPLTPAQYDDRTRFGAAHNAGMRPEELLASYAQGEQGLQRFMTDMITRRVKNPATNQPYTFRELEAVLPSVLQATRNAAGNTGSVSIIPESVTLGHGRTADIAAATLGTSAAIDGAVTGTRYLRNRATGFNPADVRRAIGIGDNGMAGISSTITGNVANQLRNTTSRSGVFSDPLRRFGGANPHILAGTSADTSINILRQLSEHGKNMPRTSGLTRRGLGYGIPLAIVLGADYLTNGNHQPPTLEQLRGMTTR